MCDVHGIKLSGSTDEQFANAAAELRNKSWMQSCYVAKVYGTQSARTLGHLHDVREGDSALFGEVIEGLCENMYREAVAKNGKVPYRMLTQLVIAGAVDIPSSGSFFSSLNPFNGIPILGQKKTFYSVLVPSYLAAEAAAAIAVLMDNATSVDAIVSENGGQFFGKSHGRAHLVIKGIVDNHRAANEELRLIKRLPLVHEAIAFVQA